MKRHILASVAMVFVLTTVFITRLIFSGLGAPLLSPIGEFGTVTNLDGANKMVVNLRIKLPDSSTLPEGYSLQALLVKQYVCAVDA